MRQGVLTSSTNEQPLNLTWTTSELPHIRLSMFTMVFRSVK